MDEYITIDNLAALFPATRRTTLQSWVDPLRAACRRYEIITPRRIAAFLSQVGHECAGFTRVEENLNYSLAGLRRTWPRRFPTNEIARRYARKPVAIANRAYANRLGNGDEASGDGWRYRGAGPIQLTGKDNHRRFGAAVGVPLERVPDYLRTPEGGALAAAWFWSDRNINSVSERGSVEQVTLLINGGLIGIEERKRLYGLACAACGIA